jgi:DNA-binding NarL/FixJ family response regulator
MTVLIADDSTAFRDRLTRMLVGCPGIDVVGEAADGTIALAEIERLQPDAVLVDLHMPRIDGFGVLRELNARGCGTPVIVLTSDASASVQQRCAALGAHAVIDKRDAADCVLPTLRRLAGCTSL